MNRWIRRIGALAITAWLLGSGATAASAVDYVLGNEDVIAVSVWLHPELAGSLTINADGNVTLAPVGEIHAAGLTTKQLGEKMADRLSAYLRQTTTVTVNVTTFMSRSVFVTGSVARPGRYGFERIPTLVDVLSQAGGALSGVDLSQVQVVRKDGATRRTLPADLATAMRTGDPSGLPELKAGDTVIVPGPLAPGSASTDGVAVLGEVARPGFCALTSTLDIWGALAASGGLTPRGNLGNVRVLSRGEAGTTVTRLDLRTVLENGGRTESTLKAGDVVVVMPKGASAWSMLVSLFALSRDAASTLVLIDYFQHRTTTTNP